MWLCSEEVEEKPRLHTLHLKGLLELQPEGGQGSTGEDEAVPAVRGGVATCASSGGSSGGRSGKTRLRTPGSCTSCHLREGRRELWLAGVASGGRGQSTYRCAA